MMIYLFLSVLSFVVVLCNPPPPPPPNFVPTPFGFRDPDCVLEVPSGSTVTARDDTVIVKTPPTDASTHQHTFYYKAPPHCGQDIEKIKQKRTTVRESSEVTNGWLDWVGWYAPDGQNNLTSFTSTYVVPGLPKSGTDGQTLYYFIGLVNEDDPSAINILQPVLTWGNTQSWYICSWICCPANITVSSTPITGLMPGSTFQGVIERQSESNWLVDSVFQGEHTTLNADVGDYVYNWADITLEVYNVNSCTDFAPGKAFFNDLVLKDEQGQTLNPNWSPYSGQTTCGGSIQQVSPTSWYIEHTEA
eukprot:TRINITY_DN15268_c0_g1_i1.p1 TRINITY_DN15268_c0_g1~~TRINITY_DN15268_c0_g1_i1.p1  ORF type:complete len:304 (+),score=40.35 TRINITY_DN15268_c0_g1_i1:2-913(+)